MLSSVLIYAMVAAVIAFVGWPLWRGDAATEARAADPTSPLERQKHEAYAALKEAEFDRRMGKLSDEDFAALTGRYRAQALAAIAGLEQAARAAEAARKPSRAPVRFAFCPGCGTRLTARANFCGACGRALRDSAA